MEQPGYFAVIPADIRYAPIPANAKLLYGEITALASKTGECFAGNAYFASLYGVTERQITRWLKYLTDNEFIFIDIDKNQGNKRTIAIDKNVYTSRQKSLKVWTKKSIPIDKNVGYNNTYNNILSKDNIIVSKDTIKQSLKETNICSKNFGVLDSTNPPAPLPQKQSDPEIDEIIEIIQSFNEGICDGTQTEQRRYGKHLINKIKKMPKIKQGMFTRQEFMNQLLTIISQNEFYSSKIGGPKKIYTDLATLIQVAKSKGLKPQKNKVAVL